MSNNTTQGGRRSATQLGAKIPRRPQAPRSGHRILGVETARDRALLEALTKKVRVLTVAQIQRAWWGIRKPRSKISSACRARLKELESRGLIETRSRFAQLEALPNRPLAAWQDGLPEPDFAEVSKVARRRFGTPPTTVTCLVATDQAGTLLMGKGGDWPAESELSHDLLLAEVYLHMANVLPTRARSWVGEGLIPRAQGKKVPDALVRDGRHRTAVELVGKYTAEKLRAFHEHCVAERLAYELW